MKIDVVSARWLIVPGSNSLKSKIIPNKLISDFVNKNQYNSLIPAEHIIEFHYKPLLDFFPKTQILSFSNLRLSIPCVDWHMLEMLLRNLKLQTTQNGIKYFFVDATTRQLFLLEQDRDIMLNKLREKLDDANKLAEQDVLNGIGF